MDPGPPWFMGVEGIMDFMGVKFMIIGVGVLSKSAYSLKIGLCKSACFGQALVIGPEEWHVRSDMGDRAILVFFPRCPM